MPAASGMMKKELWNEAATLFLFVEIENSGREEELGAGLLN